VATAVAARVDVPARALVAYGSAEVRLHTALPGCHLSWVSLAGIGRIESNRGRYGGARLLPNGDESEPVMGVPLDGTNGNAAISSSGDYAHALGPMQFIPSTWASWATDGNGDGTANINNIDDAALTAGRYLCAQGRDTASTAGWQAAILSYNQSGAYVNSAYQAAAGYARAARSA